MKWISALLFLFMSSLNTHAAGEPLLVGIDQFDPPFTSRADANQVFGFDVTMMRFICKEIERTCVFKPLRFDELINELRAGRIDVAVGAIAITRARSREVLFSIPYMPSEAQFLTKAGNDDASFTINSLKNKRVGVESGTVFETDFGLGAIAGLTLQKFANVDEVINALASSTIDYALIDYYPAQWWSVQSGGALAPLGAKIPYGLGMGIAIRPDGLVLKQSIDNALTKFMRSEQYQNERQAHFNHYDQPIK